MRECRDLIMTGLLTLVLLLYRGHANQGATNTTSPLTPVLQFPCATRGQWVRRLALDTFRASRLGQAPLLFEQEKIFRLPLHRVIEWVIF
jgi:hypothetical protein